MAVENESTGDFEPTASPSSSSSLSGAPDKSITQSTPSQPAPKESEVKDTEAVGGTAEPPQSPTPIWDENNVLVDAELDAAFKAESEAVLGDPPTPEPIDLNAPYENQQKEGQTKDPNTSPQPEHGLHTMPIPPGDYGTVPPDSNTDVPV